MSVSIKVFDPKSLVLVAGFTWWKQQNCYDR